MAYFVLTAHFLLAMLVAAPTFAQERATWRIVERSGEVELITTGARPVSLTGSESLEGGERIRTGDDGRAVLRRGGDMVIVAPNSLVQLPPANTSAFTRIVQLLGAIFVRIERRGTDAFEVQTPFLVAVVKGTIFAVSTEADGGRVHVVQGLVEVRDPSSGATYSLASGQAIQLGGSARPVHMMPAPTTIALPSSARFARDVAASTGGLLSLEIAEPGAGDAKAATGALAIDAPPGIVDITPSAGLLRGLGGNRARVTPLSPPAPIPAKAGDGGGGSAGGGGSSSR